MCETSVPVAYLQTNEMLFTAISSKNLNIIQICKKIIFFSKNQLTEFIISIMLNYWQITDSFICIF